ncbi:non-ribosomal peptide synthetase [Montanilutibacter psychrotolerans]|uniref:Amino acid adenylation domain-containing protein n=1 Tax=Montanilutibacter psychrotolerans TaxID=1327343 RepID=A0A3M8SSY8_9GAMM|nr:non-ribosomal peptide synthetase [Lysobacter psychrotolerans]RNF82344.1 amino acid adenylation domain-containing protein [Lysobacter psychrotolerans]
MSDLNERLAGLSPEKRALLMQQLARQGATKKAGIGRRLRPDRIAPSSAQQRLWILDQLSPGSAVYNVPASHWLQGVLDIAVLQRAFDEIVRRHESLRTVIACDDAGAHQQVQLPAPVPVTRLDLRHLPTDARESAALAAARDEAARPFDITRGPLLRALLVQLADDRYLLTLNAHHIAVDGWSLGIVHDELHQLYTAFQAGRESPLAELPVQYVDYAMWQNEQLDTDAMRQQLAYWQEHLSGRLPVLELPGDRARPAVQSHRGEVSRSLLPTADYENLKRLCRQERVTPFMAVLAAFNTLLLRYSGQADQIIGVGVANRSREELEPLIGFFVNTLALRTDLSGNPTFRELLARVKDATLGAYSHQDLPIERLMETLDLDRALSHSPLFQAMLFFQNFPSGDAHLPGLTLTPIDFDRINQGTARTDLSLFASEADEGLWLFLEYATDLFDEATVVAFSRHLRQLLRSVVADPSRRIAELAILDDDERRQVLCDWNDTRRDIPFDVPLHALVEAQVAQRPDAVAIEHDGNRLTYAELDAQADALANVLVAHGAGPGELVGLFVERSPRMLVALLGVLKAGAAYVPLDPGYPAERLAFMLEDAAARLVVTERDLLPQLPVSTARPVLIEDALRDGNPDRTNRAASGVGPEDLAYVIFTSGSTGRPKGVQIPHRAAVNFLASVAREPGLSAGDALCAVTTLSFDIALLELLLPLTVGARIVLADRATASDGAALVALLARSGCTVMQATPATWRMLLDAGWQGGDLRVLCGGEALTRELADRLLRCTAQVWNLYGPTETTVWSTVERIGTDDTSISIGRPLANTEVYVVDANLQPVPVGVPGELLIGGLGVARGYLSRPDLTAEKFIPDPFGTRPDARLYRTGDLARWRRDGKLEVVGRIDHQVKLRGFRIELGEIECVLAEHAAARQVVVACREDRPGDKRLVAYVVAHDGAVPTNAELRSFARERLPEYMVPATCVVLAQLPMTPNGKVDRRALPAPDSDASESDAFVAPRNAEEEVLTGLWAEVLGRERVGIHDDFFDLGGHSLLATQLITRVNKAFGGEVPLRLLFEAPTVAAFSERLLQHRMDDVDDDALAGMLDQLEGLSDEQIQALLAETSS